MTESVDDRLRRIEDQLAIYQVISGYGYAVDGRNKQAVANFYTEDAVYDVGDYRYEGRERISQITSDESHLALVNAGAAHMSTVPHVVIDGDRAVATLHTMVGSHREDGFYIARLSAARLELRRESDGAWRIAFRRHHLLTGSPDGSALLGRLTEGPA